MSGRAHEVSHTWQGYFHRHERLQPASARSQPRCWARRGRAGTRAGSRRMRGARFAGQPERPARDHERAARSGRAGPRRLAGPPGLRRHGARALPRRRRSRASQRRRRRRVRNSFRARAARRLDGPVPVPGRRRPERQRATAARRRCLGRRAGARARLRRRHDRHGAPRRRVRRQLLRGSRGRAEFPLARERQGHGRRESDHRRVLPQARRSFVLRRLLHGRPRRR